MDLSMIKRLKNAGFYIQHKINIYIDPWDLPGGAPKADIVFVTHDHARHCSLGDIKKIARPDTIVVGPHSSLLHMYYNQVPMNHLQFKSKDILGYKVEAVHACNHEKNKRHPPEKNWIGYIIDLGGIRVYHAGDTDCIPAVESVRADIALLPVGGVNVMDVSEAVRAAKSIKPSVVIPTHYDAAEDGELKANEFIEMCRKEGINGEVLKLESHFV